MHESSFTRSRPITIEIGPGELTDRIAILEIRCRHLDDPERQVRAREELDRLLRTRGRAVPPSGAVSDLARELKAVNERLWQLEDDIRSRTASDDFGPQFIETAREVCRQNDRRAVLKRSIDDACGVRSSEVKCYKSRTRP